MTHPQKIPHPPKSSGDDCPEPVICLGDVNQYSAPGIVAERYQLAELRRLHPILNGATVRNWRDVVASGLYKPVAGGRDKPDALVGIMGDKFIWDDPVCDGWQTFDSSCRTNGGNDGRESAESSLREHISLKPPVKAARFTPGTVFRLANKL